MRSGPLWLATNTSKTARVSVRPRDCWRVTALPGEAERVVQQASPLIDFAESPQDDSQPAGGNDPVIEHKSGGKLVIPLVVISRERLFKARSRAEVIALEPASDAKDVPCPARCWKSGRVLGVMHRSYRHLVHRREVGAHEASQPHAIISEEPRRGVLDPRHKLAGARKRSDRFRLRSEEGRVGRSRGCA